MCEIAQSTLVYMNVGHRTMEVFGRSEEEEVEVDVCIKRK